MVSSLIVRKHLTVSLLTAENHPSNKTDLQVRFGWGRKGYRDVILSLAAGPQVAAVGGEGVAGRQWEHRLETDGDGEEAVTAEA